MPLPVQSPDSVAMRRTGGALGPADQRDLAEAAEILRERTMSFEPDESLPAKRLITAIVAVTGTAAILVVAFRRELRWFLGL
jgi:hypothetical protein